MRTLVSGTCFGLGYLAVFLIAAAIDAFFLSRPERGDPQMLFTAIAVISPLPALLHAAAYALGAVKRPPAPSARMGLLAGLAVGLVWWGLAALTAGAESKLPAVLAYMAGILAAFFAPALVRRNRPQAKT